MHHLSDEIFESQFKECKLKPELFTHEAHLRLAYIHIKKYGEERAIQNLCLQIAIYDRTLDEGIKYHETITIVAIMIVNHFMKKVKHGTFTELIKTYPELIKDFKGLIAQHYSFDLFQHPAAKIMYIEPDLIPFGG